MDSYQTGTDVSTQQHEEDFVALLFQSIATDKLTIEHDYLAAVFSLPGALDNPLFSGLASLDGVESAFDQSSFMQKRGTVLEGDHTVYLSFPSDGAFQLSLPLYPAFLVPRLHRRLRRHSYIAVSIS